MSGNKKNSLSFERHKIVGAIAPPTLDKNPRSIPISEDKFCPDFRTGQMDMDGPWGWNRFTGLHQPDFLQHLLETQKLTFPTLGHRGSHLIEIGRLDSEAQKRLRHIQKDDRDHLYSWRITGKKRVWCLKDENLLWLLWWDPEHSVCPCLK